MHKMRREGRDWEQSFEDLHVSGTVIRANHFPLGTFKDTGVDEV